MDKSDDNQVTRRAHRRREADVEYELRVIEGSDGLLELVAKPKPRGWKSELLHLAQFSIWPL